MSYQTFQNHRAPLSRLTGILAAILLLIGVSASLAQEPPVAAYEGEEIPFDTDRGVWLVDTDGDTWPDLTEELDGSDPNDAADFPGSSVLPLVADEKKLDFPSSNCRSPFFSPQSLRLCISPLNDAATYRNASDACSVIGGRVCDVEDLFYLFARTANDANFNPNGEWLGDYVGDSTVLCGNRDVTFNNDPDILNFDGTCSASGVRNYWCCHSRN